MHQLDLFKGEVRPPKGQRKQPAEFKVVALRDCPTPDDQCLCDTPRRIVDYWRLHVATQPQFDPERECMTVLLLNTRRRVKGHQVIAIGTLDSVIIHAREVYRSAIIAAAHSIALVHNHPSGNPEPSEADLRITKDIARAGQLLKIELLDHIVIGHASHASLREMGYLSR